MNQQTLSALKGSIRKWEKIVAGTGKDGGIKNCPLCELFYDSLCVGCPVSEKTGKPECRKTPYAQWTINTWDKVGIFFVDSVSISDSPKPSKAKKYAVQELKFLKSLLPKEKK